MADVLSSGTFGDGKEDGYVAVVDFFWMGFLDRYVAVVEVEDGFNSLQKGFGGHGIWTGHWVFGLCLGWRLMEFLNFVILFLFCDSES